MAMSVLMAAGMLAGCGSNGSTSSSTASGSASSASGEVSTDGVTISIFDKNSGSNTFDDPVAKAIEEKTGVKIQVENPTGDPLEKLNLMLTGQNYPDIVLMDRGNDIVNRYIEAGALIPLNDLIDKYGPDVKEMYGETLNKSRYTDGKNYYLNNWYGEDPDPVAGVLMRYDYLCEIVGKDRADSDEPFTQEEYIDICKKFKELHPTIDGKESIAITFDAESKNYDGTLKGMYGLKTYYQDGDNLEHVAKAPNFKEMMSFANELYTEGLLDKEWVDNKKNQWTQKLSAGNVFSTFASYWDTDAANTALASSVGGDAKFYSYKILGNGISADETTYSGRSTLGWDAIAITKNCKNPEAAMKKGTQGRATVQFVVEKDGSITNVKILRGIDPELNKEAVRVISAMPKWKPGTQKGEAVRVKYTVPVMFRLTENNTQVKYAPIESKIDEMVVVGYAPEEATYPEEVTVFEVVEKMPEYPGGMSAMMEFIGKNIKYPVAAQKAKIQGRVVIQFIVDKEGNIICPRVIRGADPLLDAEAIRLTTIMPKWKPGMQRGQAVNVKYTVPIMFRLQEPEKSPAVQNATVTPTK